MILRACLSVLVLVHLSATECACYPDQYDVSVFTPAGPRDNETYRPCFPAEGSCVYVANLTDETRSLCNINFISFTSPTNSSMQIVIMDGPKVAFNLTPTDVLDPTVKKSLSSFISESSQLDIIMDFMSDTTNTSDGSISFYFYNCLKPTTPPTTTPGQTFPTISGKSEPGLIGADIAFAFVSTGLDNDMFNQMTEAINVTVSYLNVVQSKDNPIGVRLGLLVPSGTDQPNTYGDQWDLDLDLFKNFLGVMPRILGSKNAKWIPGLEAFLNDGGYFDSDVPDYKRANVQKIFAFFTQSSPSEDATALKQSLLKLKKLDVHMVVVDVRPSPDPVFTELRNDSDITNFAYMNLKVATDFLYNYVLLSDDPTYGCTYKEETQEISSSKISWPPNFGSAQYCNNQRSKLKLINANKNNLCVSIPSYELETEKDYLRFFNADGKEIASFTGYNVVGSKFLISGNETTVTFTTNENIIYKGVQFTVSATDETDSNKCP